MSEAKEEIKYNESLFPFTRDRVSLNIVSIWQCLSSFGVFQFYIDILGHKKKHYAFYKTIQFMGKLPISWSKLKKLLILMVANWQYLIIYESFLITIGDDLTCDI